MSPVTLASLAELLGQYRYRFTDEDDVQAGIESVLTRAAIPYVREKRLTKRDRIDFLVQDIGIEVKIKGAQSEVLGQLLRYAQHEEIGSLLLVTSRLQHTVGIPEALSGKPLLVRYVGTLA